eukprot:3860838-Amphidinium_carterae.1
MQHLVLLLARGPSNPGPQAERQTWDIYFAAVLQHTSVLYKDNGSDPVPRQPVAVPCVLVKPYNRYPLCLCTAKFSCGRAAAADDRR